MQALKVLVSNDDGIFAPGIKALALALTAAPNVAEVYVVAPDIEQSAVGHGITVRRPLRFRHTQAAGFGDIPAYRVDGTPTDCVILGVQLLGKPDIVVSGINLGVNLGEDLTHSGTVSAAIEATYLGIPALAVSQAPNAQGEYDFSHAAQYIARMLPQVHAQGLPPRVLLNINVPAQTPLGVRVTHLSDHSFRDEVIRCLDPMGRPYYWIAGEPAAHYAENSDYSALQDGYISVTPVKLELTDTEYMSRLHNWLPTLE